MGFFVFTSPNRMADNNLKTFSANGHISIDLVAGDDFEFLFYNARPSSTNPMFIIAPDTTSNPRKYIPPNVYLLTGEINSQTTIANATGLPYQAQNIYANRYPGNPTLEPL